LVRERLSEERKKMIDVLFNAGRTIPEAMAKRFLSQQEKTATPTATSGIVIQPPGLARPQQQQVTVRPPSKEARAAGAAPPGGALYPGHILDHLDTAAKEAPTLTAPITQHRQSGARPVAPVATPKPLPLPSEPSLAAEVTALVLRRMKPSFLPYAVIAAVLALALLWFVLSHG
jgi:hypothetical protein